MCTYDNVKIEVHGSGKGPTGWFEPTDATIYFDHPAYFPAGHTLNVDFLNPAQGPGARVAVELTETSARALADAILVALRSVPG